MIFLAALSLASCSVTDGDTIRCGDERIRIENIDTPELLGAKCPQEALWAAEARDRLTELLAPGFAVHRTGRDRYGRTLARLSVQGRDVGAVLVAEGLARPYDGGRKPWC